jgi:hypothetical protein
MIKKTRHFAKEYNWFLANRDELFEKYHGQHLVIVGEEVVGNYVKYEDAYYDAIEKYELGKFMIQECTLFDKFVKIYTPNIVTSNE